MSTSEFKTVTMEIPEEMAPAIRRDVGLFLERKHAELSAALEAVKTSRKAFKAQAGAAVGDAKEPGKRFSKVEAKRTILSDLQKLNGAGSLINEIAARTGIPYGTVHRSMMELLKDGEVEKGEDNRVRLKNDTLEV